MASAHQSGFPSTFDFVYWNVWTNFHLNDEHNIDRLKQIIKLVRPSGRLVMGLYDSVESNESKVETLREMELCVVVSKCPCDSHLSVWVNL